MTLGERLKKAREDSKISRKDAAASLGLPYNTLSNYETDSREPGSDFLKNASNLYEVTVDELLGILSPDRDFALSSDETELIQLWRGASTEGQHAAKAVLQSMQKPKTVKYNIAARSPEGGGTRVVELTEQEEQELIEAAERLSKKPIKDY